MGIDRLIFEFFYRFRTPPWEGHALPQRLCDLVEGPQRLAPAPALDVGCGTGDTSILLANNGWQVTGVDLVPLALKRATAKAAAARCNIRFVKGDVTKLSHAGVGNRYRLIVDSGCLHGTVHCLTASAAVQDLPYATSAGRVLGAPALTRTLSG